MPGNMHPLGKQSFLSPKKSEKRKKHVSQEPFLDSETRFKLLIQTSKILLASFIFIVLHFNVYLIILMESTFMEAFNKLILTINCLKKFYPNSCKFTFIFCYLIVSFHSCLDFSIKIIKSQLKTVFRPEKYINEPGKNLQEVESQKVIFN